MISAALAMLETQAERNELLKIYEQNIKTFYSIAFSKLHNRQDAEDAIQEAFLRIANKPNKFLSLSNNERIYFVSAIVKNVSIDIFNKKNKRPLKNLSENSAYLSDPELLENSLLQKVSYNELLDFINNLPELQRNVLVLTCLSEFSISETAEALQISKAAVNQRLYLARKSIKIFIERKSHE